MKTNTNLNLKLLGEGLKKLKEKKIKDGDVIFLHESDEENANKHKDYVVTIKKIDCITISSGESDDEPKLDFLRKKVKTEFNRKF